jgi:hypothetical protein
MTARLVPLVTVLLFAATAFSAPPKKPPAKDAPRVLLTVPLGVPTGRTVKVTVRGRHLDKATAVRFADARITAKLVSHGPAPVPDPQDAGRIGNTQLVMEVKVPAGVPAKSLAFVVVAPAGESPPRKLLPDDGIAVVRDKEPNDGFTNAQAIVLPQIVDGIINRPQDVDVFRFDGKAGQAAVLEVFAARHGSPLDSVLTLYDAGGREVAGNDDMRDSTDSRLEVNLPRAGTYYVVVGDAHDRGGPAHVYRLKATFGK